MKQLFNSSLLILSIVFASTLFFISCDKENNAPVESSKTLLATMSSYSQDGQYHDVENYTYDTNGRLIEMKTDNNYKVVFEYSPTTVKTKEYNGNELENSSIFTLNSKSLCISAIFDESAEGTTTYTYDDNGYRMTRFDDNGTSTINETYTVANHNYVTIAVEDKYLSSQSLKVNEPGFFAKSNLMKFLGKRLIIQNSLKSASDQINTYKIDYQFYTDKINTISFENMGITFFGKDNYNPVKQEIETSLTRPADTTTYTYEYDSKGRITKMIYSDGGYDVFTYVK